MEQFYRGIEVVMHTATLIVQQNEELQAANAASTERSSRKRKRIQKGGTLSLEEAQDLVARRDALAVAKRVRREEARAEGVARWWIQKCKQCGEPGHNTRTCRKDRATPAE
jgi:Asp-tRNA(Asn)/Glu-tRNA(Gln) amidotransferase B subunit